MYDFNRFKALEAVSMVWMLIFLLCFGFYFENNLGGHGLLLPINVFVWKNVFFGVAIFFIYSYIRGYFIIGQSALLILIGIALITIPYGYHLSNLNSTYDRLIGIYAALFIYISSYNYFNEYGSDKFEIALILSLLFALFLGYLQFFKVSDFSVVTYAYEKGRPMGVFQQPNVYASFLVFTLAPLCKRAVFTNNRSTISEYIIHSLAVTMLIVVASRTGWLSYIVMITLLLISANFNKKATWHFLSSILTGVCFWLLLENFVEYDSLVDSKSNLNSPRWDLYHQTILMILEKPVWGWGLGNYFSSYSSFTHDLIAAGIISSPVEDISHPHNELLYLWVEGGILPILGALLIVGLIVNSLRKSTWLKRFYYLSLLSPLFIHSMLEYPFYHSAIHYVLFVLTISLICIEENKHFIYSLNKVDVILSVIMILMAFFVLSDYSKRLYADNQNLVSIKKKEGSIDYESINPPLTEVFRFPIEETIHSLELNNGARTNNKKMIDSYIFWAESEQHKHPYFQVKFNLMQAYKLSGKKEPALKLENELALFYPNKYWALHK